jgi:hypothetical protein
MSPLDILQLILALLPAAEELSTELVSVVAVAEKVVNGTPVTTADLQTLQGVQATLDAQVASDAASIEGSASA